MLMWDRRKPNKPATRIGEKHLRVSGVLDIMPSGTAVVDRNDLKKPESQQFRGKTSNAFDIISAVFIKRNLVSVSDVESPRCPVTTVAWHPQHRSSIALGEAHVCSIRVADY